MLASASGLLRASTGHAFHEQEHAGVYNGQHGRAYGLHRELTLFGFQLPHHLILTAIPATLQHASRPAAMENLPTDHFVKLQQFTPTVYRDVYPAIDPTQAPLSQKGKVVIITGASQGLGARVR